MELVDIYTCVCMQRLEKLIDVERQSAASALLCVVQIHTEAR